MDKDNLSLKQMILLSYYKKDFSLIEQARSFLQEERSSRLLHAEEVERKIKVTVFTISQIQFVEILNQFTVYLLVNSGLIL